VSEVAELPDTIGAPSANDGLDDGELSHEPTLPRVLSRREQIIHFLSKDTTGGLLLVFAAVTALVVANSPIRGLYQRLAELSFGPSALHLHLSVEQWTSDGLLAIFFLAVGFELKHELSVGSLRHPREAGVPILAAVGGMAMPALIFAIIIAVVGHGFGLGGWAIPTATDIAFALAVLGLFGAAMPRGVRTFLLTLAVVDDLLAIVVIAAFYSHHLELPFLFGALACVVAATLYLRTARPKWWVAVPLGIITWALMHASGVHATIAGVLLGLAVPARLVHHEVTPRTHRWGIKVAPWSQAFALPLFAFFAAGVDLVDGRGFGEVVNQPVVLAIVAALIGGKFIGVVGTSVFLTRRVGMHLAPGVRLRDLIPVGFLAGIGFTVALLVAELSYGSTGEMTDGAKLAILCASGASAIAGAFAIRAALRRRELLATRRAVAAAAGATEIPLAPVTSHRKHGEWLDEDEEFDTDLPARDDADSRAFGEHEN